MLSGQERRNNKNLLIVHATNSVLLKRWTAHTGIVNKLTRIQEPPTVFSCSHDKTIKIWTLGGEFYSKVKSIHFCMIFYALFSKNFLNIFAFLCYS